MNKALFLSLVLVVAGVAAADVAVKGPDGRLESRLGTENGAPQRGTVRSTSVRNPVIYADCPDPTMCRAGEYVYMVTTTMFFMPGAPVMRSKDMVHWETVSYIFDRFDFGPQYSLEDGKSAYGAGQWATSLVHHNGKFYAWFIANGSGGFVFVADRPEGPWKLLTRAPHLHDCSILFDDDGRVYGFHGSGRVTELEPDFSAVKKGGLDRQLFERGEETALLEGSAAFKKDGYYYLMMVSAYLPGHVRREVCYRSRSLTGEWEKKVILETEFESYGGVGQGCVVECPDGKWRAMVFQDRGGIGRVPCLMDVTWKDGWPMLGDAEGKIPNDVAKPYPDLSGIAGSDDFGAKSLGLLWQWNHNPLEGAWSLSERPGWLRLKARRPADNIFLARNTLTQRMVAPACFGEIKMDVSKMKNGDHAGLAAFQSDSALLSVVMENGSKRLVMSEQKSVFGNGRQIKNVESVERESVPLTSDVVYMRIRADFRPGQDWAEADWSTDGRSWRRIGARFPLRFDWQRLFVGSRFALFCYSPEPSGGSVDFDYFRLERDNGADYEAVCGTSRGEVRVSSFSEGSLRVTRGRPVSPELVFDADHKAKIEVERGADATRVRSGDLVAVVSHATGLVRFEDARGRAVLSERRVGEKDIAFDSPSGERLFGLGQFQDGQLDVRNLPRRLTQVNTQISAPFLVSTRGWGLYWHNYSKIEFNECSDEIALVKTGDGKESEVVVTTGSGGAKEKRKGVVLEGTFELGADCECAFMLDCGRDMSRVQYVEIDGRVAVDNENVWLPPTIGFRAALKAGAHKVRVVANANDRTRLVFRPDNGETTFRSDVADGTDYVVYLGAPETAVAHFRADCGGTAALPDWAWGYWHCQERFVTQDDLLKAMRYFKERGLPLSVIVQDWQWWRSGTWNSMEWDAKRFPDPKGMVDECHKNGVRVMLSVWSKTEGDSDFSRAVKDAQGFIPGTPWIDFSKKSVADVYWKWFAERLVSTCVDAWWLDAVEPENDALHGRTLALGDGDRYRNVYPLLVNTEADRRMRALRPGETPLVLTRCAFPGQTRTACVMWSGDVGNSWKDLRTQIIAGLGFASAGFPYWTSDAGGFFRPGDQYTNGDYHKRLVRWLQFATFCPIQRVHGFVSDTTPSRYGERTEKLLNDQVRLREKLKPYILRVAKDVAENNAMMMRPLYDAPRGFETEYMFGPDLLVCPVTADVEEMDVWLPEGGWRDFHTGEKMSGGRVVRAKTPIDRIPVYVREGVSLASVGPAYELKYDSPAKVWEEALPLGSGFVGAMVWGGTSHETVDLNEDTVWSGSPNSNVNPDFRARLGDLRKAILDGDWKNADPGKIPGARNHGMNYQFPGSLKLDFEGVSEKTDGYRRTLSLDDAVAHVGFAADGVRHERVAFTPLCKGGFVYRLAAKKGNDGALAFRASLRRAHEKATIAVEDGTLVLRGVTSDKDGVPGKVRYTVLVKISECDGAVSAEGDALRVSEASHATVYVAVGTNFRRYDDISGDADAVARTRLAELTSAGSGELFAAHKTAYRAQADRCTLDLGPDKFADKTTDVRLADFASSDDPYFAALYFRYGRYLLISCSQPGSQPANLQGIWNNSLTPPWCSKYTVNINTEMNYWPSEVTNLGELSDPLFKMIGELSVTGAKAAEEMYGAKGWVTHHNTDIWRIAGPVDTYLACGWWPSGGGWLSTHLWEHYLYTRDRDFLAKAYPILRGAAEFYDTFAVENPETGLLAFIPSNSPENTAHGHPNGFDPVCMMDHQIARDVWRNAIEAAKVLGCDSEFAEKLGKRLEKLEPDRVGKWGQLQEWGSDLDNPGDHHRHVSHLYALYPSAQITPETPELFNAARVSLEKRGDVSTGWAMGWRVCLWARLLDGDHAFKLIQNQLSPLGRNAGGGGTYPNLFDAHPPFQIDGNFGCTAGIAEMLMQSHRGFVDILPALPKAWPSGSVKGLRARGGWTVDFAWKDGAVTRCTVRSSVGGKLKIKINGILSEYDVKPGATVRPKTAGSGADAARREWPSTCGQTTADSL